MTALIVPLAALVGVLLGIAGSGGSVLIIPLLVGVAGMETRRAIATSLLVVGLSAIAAAVPHARGGHVQWRIALPFGAAGVVGANFAGRFAHRVPEAALLGMFTVVVLLTAISLYRCRRCDGEIPEATPHPFRMGALLAVGLGVGLVTGLIGVGGGFLIVPALTLLAGLPTWSAVGTSLVIVAMNSGAGLAGHLAHVQPDLHLGGIIAAACIAGSLVGGRWSGRIPQRVLRRGLAVMIFVVGIGGAVAKVLATAGR